METNHYCKGKRDVEGRSEQSRGVVERAYRAQRLDKKDSWMIEGGWFRNRTIRTDMDEDIKRMSPRCFVSLVPSIR